MGQICTIFRNPHADSLHKNSQYSRPAVVRTMWVPRLSGSLERSGRRSLCRLRAPSQLFPLLVRPTVKVVLCVTSSIGECGKIRLALDKNFCVFSVLITTEKKGLYKKFHYSIKKKKSPVMVPKCSVFVQKLLSGQTCACASILWHAFVQGEHLSGKKAPCSQPHGLFQTSEHL